MEEHENRHHNRCYLEGIGRFPNTLHFLCNYQVKKSHVFDIYEVDSNLVTS